MRKLFIFFSLFLLLVPIAFANGEHEQPTANIVLQHTSSFIIAVIVAIVAYVASKNYKPLIYASVGVLLIGLIHLLELLFEVYGLVHVPEDTMHLLEHGLTILGLILIGLGFYKLKK